MRSSRPLWSHGWPSSTPCRPRRPARSTATRCPGRFPAPPRQPAAPAYLEGTQARLGELWYDVLGATVESGEDDFFDLGGGSLTAAQVVSRLRPDFPELTVADLYERPTVAGLAEHLDHMAAPSGRLNRPVGAVPIKTQVGQVLFSIPMRSVAACGGSPGRRLLPTSPARSCPSPGCRRSRGGGCCSGGWR